MLDVIQRDAFAYFAHETNLANGLVADTNSGHAPSSIAAIGLGLTAYPVAVVRGLMSRPEATATASVTPVTCTGVRRTVRVPSPSWPSEFNPQAKTRPSAHLARLLL